MRRLIILGSLLQLSMPAAAQTPVCTANCVIERGQPYTVAWDHPGTPATEYRLYLGLPGQTPTVIRVIPQGTPDVVVNGVIRLSNPNGPVSLPDGTYVIILGAANGPGAAALEQRSVPLTIIVRTPEEPPVRPGRPAKGGVSKP